MNRQIVGVTAGLILLGSCGESSPVEVTPEPVVESFNQAPLMPKQLLKIGGVTVICVGVEGLSQPYTEEGCVEATKSVAKGFRGIDEATQGTIPPPVISSVNITSAIRAENTEDRCSQNKFFSDGFTQRILEAARATPVAARAIDNAPDNVLHIVSESPAAKACGDDKGRLQGRYMRGQDKRPVVQFTGEGKRNDADVAAREHLHERLGRVVQWTYLNNKPYSGERLDGSEAFIEATQLGPTVMGNRTQPYLTAFQKLQLGIITPSQIAMPTAPGEVILESSQSSPVTGHAQNSGPQLLSLPLKHQKILEKSLFIGVQPRRYWVEHAGDNEVTVMVAGESREGNLADEPALIAQLHRGQPQFIDAGSGFSITLKEIDQAQAKLKVEALN